MLQLLNTAALAAAAVIPAAAAAAPSTPSLLRPAKRTYTLAAAAPRHVPAITTIYRTQIEDGLGSHEAPLPDPAHGRPARRSEPTRWPPPPRATCPRSPPSTAPRSRTASAATRTPCPTPPR